MPARGSRFPAAFRPPAFASWVILRPLGNSAFLTVGLPAGQPAGPQRGCRVAHEQDATGQGAPLTPGTAVRSRPATILRPAPAASQRLVPAAPLEHPIGGGHLHEASSGVHSRSPITPQRLDAATEPGSTAASRRSSPRLRPPDGTRTASALTPGFAPRSYPRRTPRRRRAIAHWPGYCTYGISRTSSSASHLNSCTLTSHVVRRCLHHHRGHLPAAQPVRQRQHLPSAVVPKVRVSAARRAGSRSDGTRIVATIPALPMSMPHTRSRYSGSSVTSSTRPSPLPSLHLLACEVVPPGEPGASGGI